jgi:hypothetical protein
MRVLRKATYPDIPAKMLGVLVDCLTTGVSHPVPPPKVDFPVNNEPDWTSFERQNLDLAKLI